MLPLLPFPTPGDVLVFMLVLSRVAGIFTAIPALGGKGVPVRIKAAVILMITLVCFPAMRIVPPPMPTDVFALGVLILRELAVGLAFGFLTQIIFAAVEFSGQIIGSQMGFTIANILDPTSGTQAQIMSVMMSLLATLLFFAINAHHMFIGTIVESFRVVPPGEVTLSGETVKFIAGKTADIFIIGVRLAGPVMVALLLTSIALGVMARAFPQMNIFMVSMPLNIGIGFIVLGMTLTIYFHVMENSFGRVKDQMITLLRLMAKGG